MLDHEIIGKFKEFQEKTGKYDDLVIKDVRFEIKVVGDIIDIFDAKRKPLSGLERNKKQGIYPYYGASGIIDYIDSYIFDGNYLIISEDGENLKSRKTPIAFWATGQFWLNNHAHIVLGKKNILYTDYLRLFIASNKLNHFISNSSQPKLSQTNLKLIPIPIPKKLNEKYTTYKLQKIIVEFLEHGFNWLDGIKANIDKQNDIYKRLRKSLIPSTFKKDYIKIRFAKYAKKYDINFDITDVEYDFNNFNDFFEVVTPPKKIKNKETKKIASFPVVSQSDGLINGYTNETDGIIKAVDSPIVLFGDHSTIVKYIDFDFFAGADGTKILKPKGNIFPLFAYYQTFNKVKRMGYQRHFQYLKEKKFLIPKSLEKYTSNEIQKIIADFINEVDNEIQQSFDKIEKGYEAVKRYKRTYLARTFSLIDWSK